MVPQSRPGGFEARMGLGPGLDSHRPVPIFSDMFGPRNPPRCLGSALARWLGSASGADPQTPENGVRFHSRCQVPIAESGGSVIPGVRPPVLIQIHIHTS
ncbi:hypothetical protein EHS25_009971 [Saitozyma podzolica]|uniref:Uncharacterized protein n=1 Tax=Saitozyma podzolica TaxID=1890683 RepID=A0A427YI76_9TREE|nr:hypothetical protein EHS25_009971 [Saitozyma podzolica]